MRTTTATRVAWRAPHPILARTAEAAVHTAIVYWPPRGARLAARREHLSVMTDNGLVSWIVEEVAT
jgi:hypothetical protein